MDESDEAQDLIRIVVPGEAKPYRERAYTYRRRQPGRRGQPIGSLAVGSYQEAGSDSYQKTIEATARLAMRGRPPIEGPVRLHIRSFVSIPTRTPKYRLDQMRLGLHHPCKTPDLTNIIKLAEDALNDVVFKDDKQVVRQSDDTGRYFSFRPRLEIIVEPVKHCSLQANELTLSEGGSRS